MVAVRQLCSICAYSWYGHGCTTGSSWTDAAAYYNYEPNHRSSIALQSNVAIATASNSGRSRLTISGLSMFDKRVHATAITPVATAVTTVAATRRHTSCVHGCLSIHDSAAIHRTECNYQQ